VRGPKLSMKSVSLRQILILNANWVGISFMWNALHPIILPAVLLTLVPAAQKNTYLGLITFVGLLVAIVVQPIAGAMSDHWTSRFGRRRPLMSIGTALSCLFLLILGRSGGLLWLFVGYVGLQVGSNIAQGPLQALLRDRVPLRQLGLASAVKILVDLLSLVLAAVVGGRLVDPSTHDPTAILEVVLLLLVGSAAITILAASEVPTDHLGHNHLWTLGEGFRIDLSRNASYAWLIGERAVFLLGVYGLQAFGQYYLQDVLRVPNPPQQTGDLLTAIGSGIVFLVLIGGWLVDKFGARRILFFASGLTALGMTLFALATKIQGIIVFAALVGAGIGLFLTSNWALANGLAPGDEAGKFLGLTNLATAGAAALARLQGPVVDLLNATRPQQWIGYRAMFGFGVLCILASTFFLTKVNVSNQHM
jgi:MFS family permease